MGIDSAADLLFRIGANSDDAEANIKRFRTLFNTSFGEMREQFHDWAGELFGELTSVKGALIGGGAALATAMVAAGAAAIEASHKYAEYVEQVDRASEITGIGVEHMSGLRLAARLTGADFETLTRGLSFFEAQVAKANQGEAQSLRLFREVGISQAQLAAGQKDIVPLLDLVTKRFHELGSQAERADVARGLFSRSGAQNTKMLDFLAQGIEKVTAQARALGIVIKEEDVAAIESYTASMEAAKAATEAIDVAIGRATLPLLTNLKISLVGLWEAESQVAKNDNFFVWLAKNLQFALTGTGEIGPRIHAAAMQIREMAKALLEAGEKGKAGGGLAGGDGAEKATEQWLGLSNMLESVKGEFAATQGDAAKLDERMSHLNYELAQAREELEEKRKGGKLAPGVYERELAAMQQILGLLPQLRDALGAEIGEKGAKALDSWAADVNQRLLAQTEQTRPIREAVWNAEILELRNHLAEEKDLTGEQKKDLNAMIDSLQKTGLERMRSGWSKEDAETTERIRKDLAGTADTVAAKHTLLDQQIDDEQAALDKGNKLYDAWFAGLELKRQKGHAAIDADAKASFDSEMARLVEERRSIEDEYATSEERIQQRYAADLAKYDAAAEREAKAGRTPEQAAAITTQFAAIRAGLRTGMTGAMQQLADSSGWQGVFGAPFQEMIRRDEGLMQQWATGMSMAALLVKASLSGLQDTGAQAFQQLSGGMGMNIAHAIVYGDSISKAMRQALAATLESIAAESMVRAIYATGLGFLDLALGDFEAAGNAFAAAALFGSVGAAAAVAGRAVAGPQGGPGGPGMGYGGSGGPGVGQFGSDAAARERNTAAAVQPGATAAYGAGPHVTVNVQGHVFGPGGEAELCRMLTDAVMNRGATLTATNSKTGVQVTR